MKQELETLRAELHSIVDAKIDKLIKPKIELNRWYVFTTNTNAEDIIYVTKIDGYKVYFYGLNFNGYWIELDWYNIDWNYRLATPTEVQQALEKEFNKLFTINDKAKCLILGETFTLKGGCFKFDINSNVAYFNCVCVFKDGVWAEIIEEPKTIKQLVNEAYNIWQNDSKDVQSVFINYLTENKNQIIETLNNL